MQRASFLTVARALSTYVGNARKITANITSGSIDAILKVMLPVLMCLRSHPCRTEAVPKVQKGRIPVNEQTMQHDEEEIAG